jgi:hypothetical protein
VSERPVKYGVPMPISAELLADSAGMSAAIHEALTAPPPTPEEAAARRERAARERAEDRERAVRLPLTLGLLMERMGFSTAYAEHLVQPYCTCGPGGMDDGGWIECEHARDLGLRA